jgi:hypothetical protein
MILLQVYLHSYSLLRGVTFKVLPLSNYALSPVLPSLLGTFLFLELLLWNSFQCCHSISWMSSVSFIDPLRQEFSFENSQKSFGAKLGIGWVFHFSNQLFGQKLLDSSL